MLKAGLLALEMEAIVVRASELMDGPEAHEAKVIALQKKIDDFIAWCRKAQEIENKAQEEA